VKVTTKGQVTIPIDIRERLGLLPHTEVAFEIEGNTVRIRRVAEENRGRGARLVQRLRGRSTVGMTTDEILALTRGR
jgi:AbrB family looped-hinge helix DNA binding protein